jgi:hypothetical protein
VKVEQVTMYGVRIKSKSTGHKMDFWYDDPEQRERQVKLFDSNMYDIEEYLDEQQTLVLDIRD